MIVEAVDRFNVWSYRIFSEFSRSNAFSSERNSSSLVGSWGITSGFLSSKLEWLPNMFLFNGSTLPLSGWVAVVPSQFFWMIFFSERKKTFIYRRKEKRATRGANLARDEHPHIKGNQIQPCTHFFVDFQAYGNEYSDQNHGAHDSQENAKERGQLHEHGCGRG